MLHNNLLMAVVSCCSLLSLVGCNNNLPTYEVAGKVEFEDGTSPKFGHVEFYSPEHKINAHGKINRNGTFIVTTFEENDGAVLGHHDIVIMQQVGSYLMANADVDVDHDHGSLIDKTHFDYRTSGLSCEIVEGKNEVNLVIKKLRRQTEDGLPK
jgi:hypothetical protein